MLSASAIVRLLIENDDPAAPLPDDPNQIPFDFQADIDPEQELKRFSKEGWRIPGDGPTDLYQRLLNNLGGRPRRKVANNTYLESHGGGDYISVRLHSTDVVVAYRDGKIKVNTGGWETVTTKDRINSYLDGGWHVFSQKGNWAWYNYNTRKGCYDDDVILPFTSGDTIYPDGSLELQDRPVPIKRRRKRE